MKANNVVLVLLLASGYVQADDSVGHSAQASKHSAIAASQATAVSAAIGSAVVAAPVIMSAAAASALHDASHQNDAPQTLIITDTVITVDAPPNEAMTHRQAGDKE